MAEIGSLVTQLNQKWWLPDTDRTLKYNMYTSTLPYWDQKARVFVTRKPFQDGEMKHSSLLGPLVNYRENELLWIRLQASIKHLLCNISLDPIS